MSSTLISPVLYSVHPFSMAISYVQPTYFHGHFLTPATHFHGHFLFPAQPFPWTFLMFNTPLTLPFPMPSIPITLPFLMSNTRVSTAHFLHPAHPFPWPFLMSSPSISHPFLISSPPSLRNSDHDSNKINTWYVDIKINVSKRVEKTTSLANLWGRERWESPQSWAPGPADCEESWQPFCLALSLVSTLMSIPEQTFAEHEPSCTWGDDGYSPTEWRKKCVSPMYMCRHPQTVTTHLSLRRKRLQTHSLQNHRDSQVPPVLIKNTEMS